MTKTIIALIIMGVISVVGLGIAAIILGPTLVRVENTIDYNLQVAHDQTDYNTLRKVEDTARAMVSSWHADKSTWLQYKDSELQQQQNWASGARMRANRTAANFNNFMLENNYVWSHGIPDDLQEGLPVCVTKAVE